MKMHVIVGLMCLSSLVVTSDAQAQLFGGLFGGGRGGGHHYGGHSGYGFGGGRMGGYGNYGNYGGHNYRSNYGGHQYRSNNYSNNYNSGYQPNYVRPTQPAVVAAPAPPPKPAAPAYVPPPKNVVVAKKPKPNNLRALSTRIPTKGVAESEARQAAKAAEAGGTIDSDITAALTAAAETNPAAKEALDAWRQIVAGGTRSDAVRAFITGNAGLLGDLPNVRTEIAFRATLAAYQENLRNGTLTAVGRERAIAEIVAGVEELRRFLDPNLGRAIGRFVTDMQQFNDLGRIAEMSVNTDDPLETMLLGVESAGLPVSIVGGMIGVPIAAGEAIGDATSERITKGSILFNPIENGQPVNYALNNHPYTMPEGQRQALGEKLVLTFDPGNRKVKTYTLGEGVYHWRLVDNLWDIGSIAVNVTIDNSASSTPFNYLVNGKDAFIPPGGKATHTDKFPIEVAFDRGDGDKEARKLLSVGTFAVAIDGVQSRFDLFRDNDVAKPDPSLIAAAGFTEDAPREATTRKIDKAPPRIDQLLRQMKARAISE